MPGHVSQAIQVCDVCFSGDRAAMRHYARRYLDAGQSEGRDLGAPFRRIVGTQNRRRWWGRALRALDSEAAPAGRPAEVHPKGDPPLPEWTARAGGKDAWEAWMLSQVERCYRRARKWVAKQSLSRPVPSKRQWEQAIRAAVQASDGRGYYSRWPLSLDETRPPPRPGQKWRETAMWPSVDHVVDPATAEVVIETRLVNGMKCVLDEEEFKNVLGHLAHVLAVPVRRLPDDWTCKRCFGIAQQDDEAPVLVATVINGAPSGW